MKDFIPKCYTIYTFSETLVNSLLLFKEMIKEIAVFFSLSNHGMGLFNDMYLCKIHHLGGAAVMSVIEKPHAMASLQTRVRSQAVSQPAMPGTPIVQPTIGPASSGVGEGFGQRGFTWLITL